MAVELGSGGYDNPGFKAQKVTDVNVSSGVIYENVQRAEKYEQQKPKSNFDVTHKEAATMMPNVKVHLVLVLVVILSVLLLVSIGFFSWAGWKINQHDEAIKKQSEETSDLGKQTEHLRTENEKSQNQTEKLNQTIQLIQKLNMFLINKHCNENRNECVLCQTGWIFFNESCYFFSKVYLTWDDSRQFCQNKSADLVVIDNLQEQEFIYGNVKTNTYHWLGLWSNGSNWVWIDSRIDTLRFWRSSKYYYYPSYYPSYYYYAYMYQWGIPTASWFPASSSSTFPPLCEQKAFKVSLN